VNLDQLIHEEQEGIGNRYAERRQYQREPGHSTTAHRHFASDAARNAYFDELAAADRHLEQFEKPPQPRPAPSFLRPTGDQYVEPGTKKLCDL
jgi:hypothetical protein